MNTVPHTGRKKEINRSTENKRSDAKLLEEAMLRLIKYQLFMKRIRFSTGVYLVFEDLTFETGILRHFSFL